MEAVAQEGGVEKGLKGSQKAFRFFSATVAFRKRFSRLGVETYMGISGSNFGSVLSLKKPSWAPVP